MSVHAGDAQAGDQAYMRLALEQAERARAQGEVPVGAVLVRAGKVLAVGHNQPVQSCDPSAHAEILVLRAAARQRNSYRIDGGTLYVTLEPCAMCCGALLHARLDRVVFAAADPKTGAAGSVLNLFDYPQLNHRTQVQGGVLAAEASQLLRDFFAERRTAHKSVHQPLRDDALRTPEACFADLPDYGFAPNYCSDVPALDGLRMHYVDVGPSAAQPCVVCLHGDADWSYTYRHLIARWQRAGLRVLAPDLIGFGRSDKPKRAALHTLDWHRQALHAWIERLDLQRVLLVGQGWGAEIACGLPALAAQRYVGMLLLNGAPDAGPHLRAADPASGRAGALQKTRESLAAMLQHACPELQPRELAAYLAPFPDAGHCAALGAWSAQAIEASTGPQALGAEQSAAQVPLVQGAGKTVLLAGARAPQGLRARMQSWAQQTRLGAELHLVADAGMWLSEQAASRVDQVLMGLV